MLTDSSMASRSQISMEYMLVIGFATMVTIPLVIIYMTFSAESGEEIASSKINAVGKKIVDAAESMYFLGEPSQTTLTVAVPSNIISVNASGNELVYRFDTRRGTSDIVISSAVNITGSIPVDEGVYKVTIIARTGYVEVSYT